MTRPEDWPIGAAVRHSAMGCSTFPRDKYRRGVVAGIQQSRIGDGFGVRVKVWDGKRWRFSTYHPSFWEVIPHGDLAADEAAVSLANAVLVGDKEAARALADRVMELCNG